MTDTLEERIDHLEERAGPEITEDDLSDDDINPGSYYSDDSTTIARC